MIEATNKYWRSIFKAVEPPIAIPGTYINKFRSVIMVNWKRGYLQPENYSGIIIPGRGCC